MRTVMKICIVLIIVFRAIYLNAQQNNYIREIPNERVDTIHEAINLQIQKHHILLVNNSSDSVSYYSEHGRLDVKRYAQDKNDNWHIIDNYLYCGTGYNYNLLPPFYYTWTPNFIGEPESFIFSSDSLNLVDVKIKYCAQVNRGELICSKPQSIELNKYHFLPRRLKSYYIETRINKHTIKPELEDRIKLWYKFHGLHK